MITTSCVMARLAILKCLDTHQIYKRLAKDNMIVANDLIFRSNI